MKKAASKLAIFIIVIVALAALVVFLRIFIGGSEDTWIKNEKGEYVKHGMPSQTPDKVAKQQQIITAALELYEQKKSEGMIFSSQCLGTIGAEEYVVDIVHVPRSEEDNNPENQCQDYREGRVSHFIELDKNGDLVRIV